MFQMGDKVVYGIHGICIIADIETRMVDKKCMEYYVLKPMDKPEACYYVPTKNQAAVSKLSAVLTRQEFEELLHSGDSARDLWIADENKRKQLYKELIMGSDRKTLIHMVHTLHKQKKEQLSAGRKFHQCDENFLHDAEKRLNSEFALILDIPQNEVSAYMKQLFSE